MRFFVEHFAQFNIEGKHPQHLVILSHPTQNCFSMVWQWSFRYLRSQNLNCMVPRGQVCWTKLERCWPCSCIFAPHEMVAAWFLKKKSLKMSGPNLPITMKCFSNTANLSFLIMAELISWEKLDWRWYQGLLPQELERFSGTLAGKKGTY